MSSLRKVISKLFDFLIFTSTFISACASLMTYQVIKTFRLEYNYSHFYYFVFFATVTAYNFHWYFTNDSQSDKSRTQWSFKNRKIHLLFFIIGLIGSTYQFISLSHYFIPILISILLAFFYTAPKIPVWIFKHLKKVASGKTLYLTLTWVYVTTVLPLLLHTELGIENYIYFILYRFFYIYPICILFDYRDRESDKEQGIKTFLNYYNERMVDFVFFASNTLCIFFTTIHLINTPFEIKSIALYAPSVILLLIYRSSKQWKSDYLYYFFLDGLLALPVISVL